MQDRYKFKVLDTKENKLYPDIDSLSKEEPNAHFLLAQDGEIIKKYYNNGEIQLIRMPQYKAIFSTGLKDNTKWENLSQKEKQDFYNQVCSEDGETIKYKNIEDVKHLWNGKLIYEGDVVTYDWKTPLGKIWRNDGKYIVKWNDGFAQISNIAGYDVEHGTKRNVEIIGNVYNNPELLEVQNDRI